VIFGSSLRRKNDLIKFWNTINIVNSAKNKFISCPPLLLELLWNRVHSCKIENITGKIDLFHTSDWLEPPSNCPKVTTIHDLVVLKFPDNLHPRIKNNQIRRLNWVKKEDKKIITDSYATKQDIIDLLKIPEEKIKVVYLAPRKEFKRENMVLKEEVIKEKYGLIKPYFLSVGTREPRKNLKNAVIAYNNFSKKNQIQYVIAGNFGWGKDITPNGNIKLIGYVPNDELALLYQGAVCLIYPSLYEGFGLPVLEAQSMGCPVISSDKGSLKEVLGKSALIVKDPNNPEKITEAMEEIYSIYETNKYDKMIQDGIEFSKNFSWDKTVKKTLEIYKEVVENNN